MRFSECGAPSLGRLRGHAQRVLRLFERGHGRRAAEISAQGETMVGDSVEILLAEDNEDDVLMIREAFDGAQLGNIIEVVSDGEQALRYLRREPPYENARTPRLVLLDINMPKKDGFEVLEEVKADSRLRHLPVIMLTTSHREEDVVRSYSHGACSYVTKPIDFKEFQDVVRHFGVYWTLVARVPAPI